MTPLILGTSITLEIAKTHLIALFPVGYNNTLFGSGHSNYSTKTQQQFDLIRDFIHGAFVQDAEFLDQASL